jgi:hypothetical protein
MIGATIRVNPLPAAITIVGKMAVEAHKAGMVPAHSKPEDREPFIRQQLYVSVLPAREKKPPWPPSCSSSLLSVLPVDGEVSSNPAKNHKENSPTGGLFIMLNLLACCMESASWGLMSTEFFPSCLMQLLSCTNLRLLSLLIADLQ